MKLEPVGAADALEALVAELAPGFGDDIDEARGLLRQTLDLLASGGGQ